MGGEGPIEGPGPVLSSSESEPDPSLVTQSRTHSTENPAWSGWDVLVVAVLALVTIFLSQLVIIVGAHYLLYPRARLSDLVQRPILLLISQFFIDGAVVAYLFLLVEGKYRQPFSRAIRWNWPRQVWGMLALGAATYLALAMLGSLLPMPKETPFDRLFENRRDAYLLAVMATTLGPLMEELFFRGFLFPVIARRWGAVWGVFLAALPFALLHMQQYGYSWGILVLIFGVGVVCGIVRAATRSVGASFLVHAGYNGAQMLIAVSLTHGFTRMPKGLLKCF
jgi:hypothetical protein